MTCQKKANKGSCCCNCRWLKPASFSRMFLTPSEWKAREPVRFVCWAPEMDAAYLRSREHSLCEMWEKRS